MIERLEKSDRKGKETALKVYREMLDELKKDPHVFPKSLIEMIENYEKEHPEVKSRRDTRANRAIRKFNEMLYDPNYTTEQAWEFLEEEKNACEYEFFQEHGFYMDMDYQFLYPCMIPPTFLDFPLLYPSSMSQKMPEEYEEKQ